MKYRAIALSIFIMFSLSFNVLGQVRVSDDIYSSNDIEDTTEHYNGNYEKISIHIDSSIRTGDNIAEIIAREPGITYRKEGATGSRSSVTIRGISSSKIRVFLDGVALNSSMGGAVDLSKIDPDIIERIEIYKGYVPARFGGNGFGGVINIIKKKDINNAQNIKLSALAGSFGEIKLHSESWFIPNYWMDIYWNIIYQQAKNDYFYINQGSTPLDASDDDVKKMVNDKYNQLQFHWAPSFYLRNNRNLNLNFHYHVIEDEIAGAGDIENHTAVENSDKLTISTVFDNFSSLKNKSDEFLNAQIGVNYSYVNNLTYWTNLDNFGIAHGFLKNGEWGELLFKENVIDLKGVLSFNFNKNLNLENALILQGSSFLPESKLNSDVVGDWDSYRISANIASELSIKTPIVTSVISGSAVMALDSTAGGNGGYDDYFRYTVEPQRDINWDWALFAKANTLLLNKKLVLGLSGGRNNNLISLREKYGTKSGVVPNPELKDQSLYSFDISADFVFKKLMLGGTFFFQKEFNPVLYYRSGNVSKPINIDESLTYGGEFDLSYYLLNKIGFISNLTIQSPMNQQRDLKGKLIPDESQLSLYCGITAGPFWGLTLIWDLEYNTRYFKDPENKYAIPYDNSLVGSGNNAFGMKLHKKNIVIETYIKNLPLQLFNQDHYKNYAYEYGDDQSGNGYGYGRKPGIKYYVRINYSL